jgi:hypothetical protein
MIRKYKTSFSWEGSLQAFWIVSTRISMNFKGIHSSQRSFRVASFGFLDQKLRTHAHQTHNHENCTRCF